MQVVEAKPEIDKQAQEIVIPIAGQPEALAHAETSPDMTSEQAIKVCPYLGKLAAQDPKLAKQKAQEYISDPEKMAQLHPNQEGEEVQADDQDSFWDDLEAEFSTDEIISEEIEERKSELSEDLVSEPGLIIAQFDKENAAAREEILKRQFSDNKDGVRRKSVKSEENVDHVVDIGGIVHGVIAANPQACQDFRNGNSAALDILVKEATQLSKATS